MLTVHSSGYYATYEMTSFDGILLARRIAAVVVPYLMMHSDMDVWMNVREYTQTMKNTSGSIETHRRSKSGDGNAIPSARSGEVRSGDERDGCGVGKGGNYS